jgi:hypothetical protein
MQIDHRFAAAFARSAMSAHRSLRTSNILASSSRSPSSHSRVVFGQGTVRRMGPMDQRRSLAYPVRTKGRSSLSRSDRGPLSHRQMQSRTDSMNYQPGHPHGLLSNLDRCGRVVPPVAGSDGVLATLKSQTSPFPDALKHARISRFLWEANFSVRNAEIARRRSGSKGSQRLCSDGRFVPSIGTSKERHERPFDLGVLDRLNPIPLRSLGVEQATARCGPRHTRTDR